jgi:wyosine [tRNA(Phe)-imidazoG37] synthetase (radical SAM superfamily)
VTPIAFGPVPSRRLGRSLGINNIPPKVCSYSCVYCQVGRTARLAVERSAFYPPEEVVRQVEAAVRSVRERGEAIDYLTFVPDGEPTLDVHLGREIASLRPLGIPIAVISNASLLDREDVQSDLARADWVSLKVDTVREEAWRRLNRPHRRLALADQLCAGLRFSRRFAGTLATETLLVRGLNDDDSHLDELGRYLEALGPDAVFLSAPTRPPAEAWVRPPAEDIVLWAWQSLSTRLPDARVELLIADEGNAFASTGDVRADLLAITAVHPMREDAVADLLARAAAGWPLVEQLVSEGLLARREHQGRTFYLRRLARKASPAVAGAAAGGTS